jgi:peptide/nickel transport system substrate-binding protein
MLADMVQSGSLPEVDERLPTEPRTIQVVEEIGQFGGTWRRAFIGPSDGSNWGRVSRRGLLSWTMDGSEVVPQVAKGWEISDDLTTFTFQMRKDAKWSDGEPFTADDVLFWWEAQVMNDEMSPSKPSWFKIQGELGSIEKVDDYTFVVTFAHAYPLILDWFANRTIYSAAHYMSQYHPEYTDDRDALMAMVAEEGFDEWYQLYGRENNYADNPELPLLCAWTPENSTRADTRFVWQRNPYYFCVDPEGNQLPYLDEVVYEFVDNVDVLNLRAAGGEIDMQGRHVSIDNYPVLMDGREQGDYRVLLWPNSGGADAGLMFNQGYLLNDPAVGEWLANTKFRQALSIALDREELNEAAFLGLGEARQLAPPSYSPFYPGDEHVFKYTEYDPDMANEWLDEIGLDQKNDEGFRLRPDGEVLDITMLAVEAFGPWADVGELAAQYWQAVGVKAQVEVVERSLYYERMRANEMQIGIWNTGGAEHTFTYPYWASAYSNGSRIGPVYGLWWTSGGQSGEEPPEGPLHRVMDLHEEGKGVLAEDRAALGQEIFRINCEELWTIGTIGLSPMVMGVIVCKNDFRNVPEEAANNVIINTPGNAFPEQFFWKK